MVVLINSVYLLLIYSVISNSISFVNNFFEDFSKKLRKVFSLMFSNGDSIRQMVKTILPTDSNTVYSKKEHYETLLSRIATTRQPSLMRETYKQCLETRCQRVLFISFQPPDRNSFNKLGGRSQPKNQKFFIFYKIG